MEFGLIGFCYQARQVILALSPQTGSMVAKGCSTSSEEVSREGLGFRQSAFSPFETGVIGRGGGFWISKKLRNVKILEKDKKIILLRMLKIIAIIQQNMN